MSGTPAGAAWASPASATLARIPYLNAEPFYAAGTPRRRGPSSCVPRASRRGGARRTRRRRTDGGRRLVRARAEFERVGGFGIACRGAVESVLLLGGTPVDSLAGGRVVLTTESSTSAALVRILLGRRFGLADVRYERGECREPGDTPAGEAWLVIGDSALAARRAAPGSVMLDLGQAWASGPGCRSSTRCGQCARACRPRRATRWPPSSTRGWRAARLTSRSRREGTSSAARVAGGTRGARRAI